MILELCLALNTINSQNLPPQNIQKLMTTRLENQINYSQEKIKIELQSNCNSSENEFVFFEENLELQMPFQGTTQIVQFKTSDLLEGRKLDLTNFYESPNIKSILQTKTLKSKPKINWKKTAKYTGIGLGLATASYFALKILLKKDHHQGQARN